MMQEDQKGCKKNNIRAEEEQITAARAKQHEDEEEDTGIRPKKDKNIINKMCVSYFFRNYYHLLVVV